MVGLKASKNDDRQRQSVQPAHVVFNSKKITLIFALIAMLLVLLHLGLQYINFYGHPGKLTFFVNIFDLDNETSVPTWFSQFSLLFAAFVAIMIATSKSAAIKKYALQWKILAGILVFLSIDEIATIHEQLIGVVSRVESEVGATGINAWYVYAAILVGLVGIVLIKFWWHLPVRTKILLAVAVVVYLFGAVYSDVFNGGFVGQGYLRAGFLIAIEEGCEMAGVIIVIYTLLDYAKTQRLAIQTAFSSGIKG